MHLSNHAVSWHGRCAQFHIGHQRTGAAPCQLLPFGQHTDRREVQRQTIRLALDRIPTYRPHSPCAVFISFLCLCTVQAKHACPGRRPVYVPAIQPEHRRLAAIPYIRQMAETGKPCLHPAVVQLRHTGKHCILHIGGHRAACLILPRILRHVPVGGLHFNLCANVLRLR